MNFPQVVDKTTQNHLASLFGSPAQMMQAMEGYIKNAVKQEFGNNATILVKSLIDSRLKEMSESILTSPKEFLRELLNLQIEQKMNQLDGSVKLSLNILNEKIKDTNNINSPQYYINIANEIREKQYQLNADMAVLRHQFNQISARMDSMGTEEVKPEEIKNLMVTSGVTLKEICSKFDICMPTASKWSNGKMKNPQKKRALKNYLKSRINDTKED